MSAREELAQSIATNLDRRFGKREFGPAHQDYELADALLAEGWRKVRVVTTVEELEALPVGSVVRDAKEFIYEKCHDIGDPDFPWWASTGEQRRFSARFSYLPATVLCEPQS